MALRTGQQDQTDATSNLPAVVGPVQQRLSLSPATVQITRLASLSDLGDVPLHLTPTLDLAVVIFRAPAHVVTAVPLEPAPRIIAVNPAVFAPHRQRLRSVHTEKIEFRITTPGGKFCAPEPACRKLGFAIRHVLPAEYAERKELGGGQLRGKAFFEISPHGFDEEVRVALLHAITDGDAGWLHGRLRTRRKTPRAASLLPTRDRSAR